MKKKYIFPTVIVRYISTEYPLAAGSALPVDNNPRYGIQGDAKRDSKIIDDSEVLDELGEQEASFY